MNERELTADFGAVLDANVLANLPVCDLLLRLAETPRLYIPFFSEELLTEVERTHRKLRASRKITFTFLTYLEGGARGCNSIADLARVSAGVASAFPPR